MVYIEDAGADNDGQIGAGIDVMVPTNGLILSWGREGGEMGSIDLKILWANKQLQHSFFFGNRNQIFVFWEATWFWNHQGDNLKSCSEIFVEQFSLEFIIPVEIAPGTTNTFNAYPKLVMIDGALASSDGITFTFTARGVWDDCFHDEMERCGETLKAHLNHLKLEKENNS